MKNQWIKLTDKMPKVDEIVLHWGPHHNKVECDVLIVDFMGSTLTCAATHWMPLPKPPENKNC